MKLFFYRLTVGLLTALCLFSLFISCSRSEPRILHGFIELVYYSTREGVQERFSFFVLVEDDDGVENLSELYLFHDRDGLRWSFTSGDWVIFQEDDMTWIGSRNIAMYGNDTLPRGQYRAVLVNAGGERTERRFTFDSPEEPPFLFPTFSVIGDFFAVNSQYPLNHFIGYDYQGRASETRTVYDNYGSIDNLGFSGDVISVALWAEDPDYLISALTEAVIIR